MASPFSPRASETDTSPNSPNPRRNAAFPFPAQNASSSRQSSTTRFRSRRGSTASITSVSSTGSIGGSLDVPSLRSSTTLREISQNAISTLLQPPIVRTGLVPHTMASAAAAGFKQPTQKDIPPVTLTNVPHVPTEQFRHYLDEIGPLFETLHRGRSETEQSSWGKKDKLGDEQERLASGQDIKAGQEQSMSPTLRRQPSINALSPIGSPIQPKRRSSGQLRRNRNEPTPLSTVPNVYFDENFHLENPRIFDVVSERAEIIRPPPGALPTESQGQNGTVQPPRKALATNAILQEKLSWYMDTVEVHLINSISTASSGFFAALGSLKELQTEAEQSVAKIKRLREDLHRLDKEVALSGLEVATKKRRSANVQRLGRATAQVQSVVENVRLADKLVEQGAYDEAADQMDRVGRLVRGKPENGAPSEELVDLRRLKALQGLDSGLQELQLRIGAGYASRFTKILLTDIRQHVDRVSTDETLKRLSRQRGIPPRYMESNEEFRTELSAALKGLERSGHMAPATAAYREAVTKEMKSLVRRHMPSSSDEDADSMVSISTRGGKQLTQQDKSSILARNLRALDPEDAEKLLVNVYCGISEALRRVSTQTKILLDLTSNMQAPDQRSLLSSPIDPPHNGTPKGAERTSIQEELSQGLDMSSLLGQAVDTAQLQITRVLKVRNEQFIRLPNNRFLRYFMLNRIFADECEAVSGRGGTQLKSIINAQISGFVQVLGTAETERIANLLHSDSWNASDFTERDNLILQRILASMSTDPPEWATSAPTLWESPTPESAANGGEMKGNADVKAEPNGATPGAKAQTKPAHIEEERFILVSSAASLLTTVDIFLSLTAAFPTMTSQIATSLLEVLRTFNSRSCQLILGAGARAEGGLKTITTKHLALASQALSFVIALVPYMRECVRRHIPGGQGAVLAEFDKTKRLFQDHQTEIHDKLVEIMTSRSQIHVRAMKSINFDTTASVDDKPSAYMETLTKETLTLHRVLSRHLNDLFVGMIMQQIFKSYKDQWTKAFTEVGVTSSEGERRLLRDATCFEARLGKIDGFGAIGQEILALVQSKVSAPAAQDQPVEKEKSGTQPAAEEAAGVKQVEESQKESIQP